MKKAFSEKILRIYGEMVSNVCSRSYVGVEVYNVVVKKRAVFSC